MKQPNNSLKEDRRQVGFLSFIVGAKGAFKVVERFKIILQRYGFSPQKMDKALNLFLSILSKYHTSATFPTPAVVVHRYAELIRKYQASGIEFALHGLRHIDYSQLSFKEQVDELGQAKAIFSTAGIEYSGFRTPYLRRDDDLNQAITEQELSYSSNQPIIWEAVDLDLLSPADCKNYLRGLEFYDSWSAKEHISLPSLQKGVVHIPVSLPDDEMLLDRISNGNENFLANAWSFILEETYLGGELFTLQLHPERISLCNKQLDQILKRAKEFEPRIWIATLREINQWWRNRLNTAVQVSEIAEGNFQVAVSAPDGVTILIKNGDAGKVVGKYSEDIVIMEQPEFRIQTTHYPGVGIPHELYAAWYEPLRQHGYLVERCETIQNCAVMLTKDFLIVSSEREVIAEIESTQWPLVKIGTWPDGYKSALSITGDLDGMTLWDYVYRLAGK